MGTVKLFQGDIRR